MECFGTPPYVQCGWQLKYPILGAAIILEHPLGTFTSQYVNIGMNNFFLQTYAASHLCDKVTLYSNGVSEFLHFFNPRILAIIFLNFREFVKCSERVLFCTFHIQFIITFMGSCQRTGWAWRCMVRIFRSKTYSSWRPNVSRCHHPHPHHNFCQYLCDSCVSF